MKREGIDHTTASANSTTTLTEQDHRSLVIEFNDTVSTYPANKTIVQLFESQVARTPSAEAVRLGDRFLNYAQLNERANQFAAHLRTLGAGPETFVALYMERSIEVVCAILGALKAGAAYVPIDPASTPGARLSFILKDISEGNPKAGGSPVLVAQSRLLSQLPKVAAEVTMLDEDFARIEQYPFSNPQPVATTRNLAYSIYTSGSTGMPKGVLIERRSVVNYIWWANRMYCQGERLTWPLFSSLAFDLTVTSIFTPLISGGRIVVYPDDPGMHGMAILKVVEDNAADIVKLTPSHLAMIKDLNLRDTKIRKLIVGGEDFKTKLASDITRNFGRPVEIYNEYGPTEATVGCMIHRFDEEKDRGASVPIGTPAANSGIYILDEQLRPVPKGVLGEMYIAGDGLARGYLNQPELTEQKFVTAEDPRQSDMTAQTSLSAPRFLRLYKTGDIARWSEDGRMEFLGRADSQVKIGGMRIELGEIEGRLRSLPGVSECAVDVFHPRASNKPRELTYCSRCGVASNLPGTTFDGEGVCNICRSYDSYVDKAQAYFKTPEEFKVLAEQMKANRTGEYDCVVLFSGGKDSTYMLYKVKDLGLKALAFTLDNGFLSEEALANIRRIVQSVGVDHVFGKTPHMNEIFVDSLKQFSNVCNGCFKTVYTLATNLAHEKGIRYILTGLSRGQFFETRLTEEVFQRKDFDVQKLDALVLDARKAYHQRKDAVSCHLAVDILQGDGIFDEIQFVDFYRYWSVPLEELYAELKARGAWFRPSDTGRSTNCVINDLGIYLHKKQRGFHNYSLPYSWDVRLNQKTRDEAMEELEDEIDETRVKELMVKIGYTEPSNEETSLDRLVAYYVSEKPMTVADVRAHLAKELPEYMVPTFVVRLEKMPLTPNGKIDRKALPAPTSEHMELAHEFVRPETETEKAVALIWTEILKIDNIGINDEFFDLGGHSLLAIRAVSRIRDVFGVEISLETLFENPTISSLANVLNAAKGSEAANRIERRQQSGPSPLSFMQEQLWFLDQFAPGSPVYNMSDVVEFHGKYNAEAMHRALQEMVRRHEILRTSFSNIGGQPVQTALPEMFLPLAEMNLSSLPTQEREDAWSRIIREQVRKPFDLSKPPLLRATLVSFSAAEHRLLLTTHHILADEWSMEIVHQELQQLYAAFSEGRPSPLSELPIQYADFACWQRDWLKGESLEQQVSYWREALSGAPTVLELPTDKPRPAEQRFLGATEFFKLPKDLCEDLKALGREQQATLFMSLEAVFAVLLHRYTGQDDILVGTPISGRNHSEMEGLIGYFLNMLTLRAQFSERMSFRSMLKQVRDRALGAYAHPDLPFEHLVSELAPERDLSRSPLFQVVFVLHNPEGVSEVSQVSGNHGLATGTSKFDLTLVFSETADGLEGMIEYNTDLFESSTIRRMFGHYRSLLEAVTRNPEQSISHLPMLTAAERQQQLVDWNETAVEFPRESSIHELIEAQAQSTPDAIAVAYRNETMTYRELNRRANGWAHRLRELGVNRGVLVGILLQRSPEFAIAVLSVLKAGGTYVPLDPKYPEQRLADMLEIARCPVVITTTEKARGLSQTESKIVCIDRGDRDGVAATDNPPVNEANSQDCSYVIFTSGSTGKPNGVMIEHRSLVNNASYYRDYAEIRVGDRVLQFNSVSFDVAGEEIFPCWLAGATLVFWPESYAPSVAEFSDFLEREKITHVILPSAYWHQWASELASGDVTLPSMLRIVVFGGEKALLAKLAAWKNVAGDRVRLCNAYGPTEATIIATIWEAADGVVGDNVSIGRPVPNTTIYVLDRNMQPVPPGVPGELYIGGAGIARGYLNRPELTAKKFVTNPFRDLPDSRLYKTGDRVRYLASGDLEFLGRFDSQVKVNGYRIELGEIEAALSRHPGVRHCAVIAREDRPGDKTLVAYFEMQTDHVASVNELRSHMERLLPEYMIPSAFVAMEHLPLTPNGKIDAKVLLIAGKVSTTASESKFAAPRDAIEIGVADIWKQILSAERIGIHDNFFDLGGNSLKAVQVCFKIKNHFGADLPISSFYQNPTIGGISAILAAPRNNGDAPWAVWQHYQNVSSQPPLIGLHAVDNIFGPIAKHVASEFPFHLLTSRVGFDGSVEPYYPCQTVEEMAERYLEYLRSYRPKGPYFLIGFCLGGLIAYEVARRLTEEGEEVPFLGLFNTIPSSNPTSSRSFSQRFKGRYRRHKELSFRGQVEYARMKIASVVKNFGARAAAKLNGTIRPRSESSMVINGESLTPERIVKRIGDFGAHMHSRYAPLPYKGKVCLFYGNHLAPDLPNRWARLVSGGIEAHLLPGEHITMMEEPYVQEVAAKMNAALEESLSSLTTTYR